MDFYGGKTKSVYIWNLWDYVLLGYQPVLILPVT